MVRAGDRVRWMDGGSPVVGLVQEVVPAGAAALGDAADAPALLIVREDGEAVLKPASEVEEA